jgi:colanic acid/amylovoran biosynthesis glycosyltransferase
VTTGSLVWVKGYEYALQSIRHLVDQGIAVQFDLIGEGPERQRILYTIHDLGLEGRVHLHGRLSPEEVRDKLQQADAFLLSSLSEGISNAALEAMACGLPVVTTDCGGMREAIRTNVEGIIVPVRESKEMSQALATLWDDTELRTRMGQAARKRVLQEFTLSQQVNNFASLCENTSGVKGQ